MKRNDLLNALKFAGYHADPAAFTRLVVENRISITTAGGEYARGIQARKAGMKCGCSDCVPMTGKSAAEESAPITNDRRLAHGLPTR